VKKDPGRYLQPCSDSVKTWLHSMKTAGKVLLLITSSHSDYCRLICEHIIGKDFEELFDVIITNALKPGFFSLVPHQRPFRTLGDFMLGGSEHAIWCPVSFLLLIMKKIQELLDCSRYCSVSNPVELSLRSDMFPATSFGKWETVMVVEEMEGESVPKSNAAMLNEAQVEPLEKRGKFEYKRPFIKVTFSLALQVVYFGDSLRSDMFPATSFGKWETVMVVEEMEGESVPKSNAAMLNEAQVEPLEKRGKFEEQGMKSPSAVSNQWGSYFVDVHKSGGGDEEQQKLTWCCHCIHKYSTMAIPSVEHIAGLPLDYKFPRFSPDKPCTTGYYPRPPESLLKRCENLS
ncbi:unnamed protein product, partial [Menidia menidia]